MDVIEKEFGNKALIRGGIYLYRSMDAIAVIRKCHLLGSEILGIDSFIITNGTTQPVLEHSIDFSTERSVNDSWMKAERFINHLKDSELFFEIVYE